MPTVAGVVQYKKYNYETRQYEETGESVDLWELAQAISPDEIVKLLALYMNGPGNVGRSGPAMGYALLGEHRALQEEVMLLLFNFIAKVGDAYDDGWTDERNARSFEIAARVRDVLVEEFNFVFRG